MNPLIGANAHQPEQQKISSQIKLQDTTEIVCEECGHNVFQEGFLVRSVSPILTGTGAPGILPLAVLHCVKCGHVNEQFLPKEKNIV